MPRTFTPHDLTSGITTDQYLAMSPADQLAFDHALVALWETNAFSYVSGDYDRLASYRRYEVGE